MLLFFQAFRDHSIDGSALLMLKEHHLVTVFKMKLGTVLKFKSTLASKIGSCPVCLHCIQCHVPKKPKQDDSKQTQVSNGDKKDKSQSTIVADIKHPSEGKEESSTASES